jgi:hypothetical protein
VGEGLGGQPQRQEADTIPSAPDVGNAAVQNRGWGAANKWGPGNNISVV